MANAIVGRGLVEILPDFRKWGKQLAADMKIATQQAMGAVAPIEGAVRDSQGRLRDSQGRFIKEYQNGWKAAAGTAVTSMAKVGKGVSLVGLGVAIAATKMAGDFQAETAVLQTAAGESAKGLKVVRAGILDISKGTGTGIKDLTDGMYTIEKAGFRGANGLQILKAAAQGAREENANLADVTNAMTSIMASYHLKAGKSVQVMNAMKTAAGEGKITMEEFSGALSTVLPIASANKISLEEVTGAMATLTQHGTSAREATHELGATIRALAAPNNVASREMARFGLSSVDVSTKLGKRGLTGTFDLLTETILKKMGPSGRVLMSAFEGTKQSSQDAQIMMGKMTGATLKIAKAYLDGKIVIGDWNTELKGAAVDQRPMLQNFKSLVDRSRGFSRELKTGGPAAKTYTEALKKMSGGAIGLNTILQVTGESAAGNKERVQKIGESFRHVTKDVEGWKITQGLLNVQMARARQAVKVLMIEIGTKLIPVVSAVVGFFADHNTVLMVAIGLFAGFLGVLSATYIGMKLYAMYTALATAAQVAWTVATMAETDSLMIMRAQLAVIWVGEMAIAAASGIAAAAQWAWNIAMTASPIGLIILGIAALIAAIVLIATKTTWFQTAWKATWKFVTMIVGAAVDWIKHNWQMVIFVILTGPVGLAVVMIVRHWKGIVGAFRATIDWIKHNWPLILAILGGPVGLAVLYIVKHWGMISDGAKTAFHAVINFAVDLGHTLADFFSKLPGRLGGFFSKIPGVVGHWFVVAGKAIGSFFADLPGKIQGYVNGFNSLLLRAGQDLISGLFHGITSMFKAIPGVVGKVKDAIVSFFKAVFGIHSPSTVMALIGMDLIRGLIVGAERMFGLFAGFASSVRKGVTTAIGNLGRLLYSHGRSVISGLLNGAVSFFGAVAGYFRGMPGRVASSFGNVGRLLYNKGRDILSGLHNGAASFIGSVLSYFRSAPGRVSSAFGNVGRLLYNKGRDIVSSIRNGGASIWGSVSSWVSSRPAAISSALGSVGNLLYNKGRSVLNGLLSGLKAPWKALTSWVGNIAQWIKDHKGPLSLDARLLTPAGKALMRGLLKGLKIGFKSVGTFIYGTGDTVADIIGKIKNSLAAVGSALGLGNPKAVGSAQQYAQLYLKAMGWGPSQWPALKALWQGESGWNAGAYNKSSGATGIPQALPGSKMASEGSDWRTNAATQIRWGEKYIKAVYGSPVNAYTKWLRRSPHWYDAGGIARGVGAMFKNTNEPERVLSPQQTRAFDRLVSKLPVAGAGGGSSALVIERLVLENHGVLGSRVEVENWLVDTLDQLRRKGRIK